MDELMQKLEGILSTKEGQEQLKNLQNMFFGEQDSANNDQPNEGGLNSLSSLMSASNQSTNDQQFNIDPQMIMTLQKVMSGMNKNDKNTQLLLALKPHFSQKRQEKVDKAVGLMRIMSMLPMLKESGILKSFF